MEGFFSNSSWLPPRGAWTRPPRSSQTRSSNVPPITTATYGSSATANGTVSKGHEEVPENLEQFFNNVVHKNVCAASAAASRRQSPC
ncbi:hypothetical protein HPP92_013292 [Vanilla planifolia]|uniref:Uncharacterized protein n=1 Tax=Vanilla planifolia TaxID=51239 RepID=A0A835QVB9_VANPL|nr:hypothetical protein HPP92_013292 [Vanilla planifolia]